ncbi:MAG: protein kinase [Deltaproteobacteria bacterium]|nr:protein kinase [Deltaproteobacteria bacterium]
MPEEKETGIHLDFSDRSSIGRYHLVRKIGEGRTGTVYECNDPLIDRPVAIKVSGIPSPRVRENFFLEAKSAARLAHKNIVTVYDANVVAGEYAYIAMEYVNGSSLEALCNPQDHPSLAEATQIVREICDAMEHAHEVGVIHRDLHPGNILLHENRSPKITHFRIKDTAGARRSPEYLAPEQLQDVPAGPQSDIFSVGCILYELLSGQKAFSGKDAFAAMYKVINEEPEPLASLVPDIPRIYERIIKRALAKDLRRRYQNFGQMAYDLKIASRALTMPVKKGKVDDVIDYVHSVSFFSGFSRNQIEDLLAASELIQVKKGEEMLKQGELDDAFYVLLSGKGLVYKNGHQIGELNAGESFGEMAFIGGQPRTASVMADTDGVMMKISGSVLDRAPARLQNLFFRKFALLLVDRLTKNSQPMAQETTN